MTVGKTNKTAFKPGVDGEIETIQWEHELVHDGEMYRVDKLYQDVANAGTAMLYLACGTQANVHATFSVSGAGAAYIYLYEDIGATTGTSVNSYNMNRSSTNTPYVSMKWNPVTTTAGTAMQTEYMPGGAGSASATRVGNSARSNTEWVLKAGKNYAVSVTNASGTACDYSIGAVVYEVTA